MKMKGLLLKDFYMTLKYCKAYMVIAVIFLALIFVDDGYSMGTMNFMFLIYPCVLSGVIPVNLLAYDEKSRWIQYSATLPYTRAQLVNVKYLMGFLLQAAMLTLTAIAFALRMAIAGTFQMGVFALVLTTTLAFALFSSSITMPFVFKFGVEKGRVAYYFAIGGTSAIGIIASEFLSNGISLSGTVSYLVLALLLIGCIGLYALSWLLSIAFYKKREF